ncbi:PadR family transcriptional regulator [Roseivirga misakiensis]|uniref:PadR family transcriptional regulator n=1 Tax=Roseivirga misakiensis TaxID=1563681 RepID=A0A1E5T310_9BACT|nr:PadR family transcriptional regulator [Roseivirga misakiensis]OEK05764.1 PadR family transcriptional regulator [Roseivirga misakiensis]
MGKHHLGEFEEIVMLTVAILHGNAYGFSIIEEIEKRLERGVSLGALQVVLKRLEKKGYLQSELGESSAVRGGRKKRYYSVTHLGKNTIRQTREQRMQLWDAIPDVALQYVGK